MAKRRLPPEVQATLVLWIKIYRRWWRMHYTLGIVALFFSVTVASRPQFQSLISSDSPVFGVLAWLAALSVGLMTFLTPSKKARSYVAAARILSNARNHFENDPEFPMESLLDAVKQGEELIAQADPI